MSRNELPGAVCVVGAGTMGAGIALAFARSVPDVRLVARRATTLERARARIRESVDLFVRANELERGDADEVLQRIRTVQSLGDAVAGAELVVESIPEDLGAKKDLLEAVEHAAEPGTLVTTDTSSLSLSDLSSVLRRPEDFAGFHWFNPPELVLLVEIVSGPDTSKETVSKLVRWSEAIGMVPIYVRRDIEGFVANRLQYALLREAFALTEAGVCTYAEIDEAVRAGLGARWAAVGPFESMDLAGLDVHHAVAQRLYPALANGSEPAAAVSKLVAGGALGCKTGRGLHGVYDEKAIASLVERRAIVLLALARLERERRLRS